MKQFDLEENLTIQGEVAYNLKVCDNKEAQLLYVYKLLNIYSGNPKQKLYADAVKRYLSNTDYTKVIAEISYGKFDNTDFWINKTVKDIEEYYPPFCAGVDRLMTEDTLKCSFYSFIRYKLVLLSKDVAYKLINKVIENKILSFLHSTAFCIKMEMEDWQEDSELNNDIRYLELLDMEFSPGNLMELIELEEEGNRKDIALEQRNAKRNEVQIASQLSLKNLLEKTLKK